MSTPRFLNSTIVDLIGRGKIGDVFGVELELEGRGVGMDGVAARGWKRTQDGSLRGESVEYVFSDPCTVDVAKDRVTNLFGKFAVNGVDIKNSYRTSTHVHLNFGDKKVKQLLNFFTLFTMLEEILEQYSGEDRAGNLFCLSSRRGEAIIEVLIDCVKRNSFDQFANDRYKYAACNLSTLYKFGTAEVRTMRGATSAQQVNDWLDILNQVYLRSQRAKSPVEFIENISILGPDGFLADVFTPAVKRELVKGLPAAFNFRASLLEGARLCQLFAYELADDYEAPAGPVAGPAGAYTKPGALHNDGDIFIYNARGDRWHCGHPRGAIVWCHGDALVDDGGITFDEDVGRFQHRGRYLWFRRHPVFGDEAHERARHGMVVPGHLLGGVAPPPMEHNDFDEDEIEDDDF